MCLMVETENHLLCLQEEEVGSGKGGRAGGGRGQQPLARRPHWVRTGLVGESVRCPLEKARTRGRIEFLEGAKS